MQNILQVKIKKLIPASSYVCDVWLAHLNFFVLTMYVSGAVF